MKNSTFTILVNSSDGFEDCWFPFFRLLETYWPNCSHPIVLNTEYKDYKYSGLNVTASKANDISPDQLLTWSSRLIKVLEKIETPLVLYMQEDYFVEEPVKTDVIERFASILIKDPEVRYIGLTHFGNRAPFKPYSKYPELWQVTQNSDYRISTQAGLWHRDTLLSYLRADENIWMFEIFGTQRAKRKKELFLTANRDLYSPAQTCIVNYVHTGVIKGKWHPAMVPLFKKHGIKMDFDKRGFWKQKPYLLRKIETGKKLLKDPGKFFTGMMGR
jgi:hypothetical protein